jgi:protein gp37
MDKYLLPEDNGLLARESGKWVTDIRDQCLRARVPFFFKQWGGVQKKRAGRILEGRTWDEMPVGMNLVKV